MFHVSSLKALKLYFNVGLGLEIGLGTPHERQKRRNPIKNQPKTPPTQELQLEIEVGVGVGVGVGA